MERITVTVGTTRASIKLFLIALQTTGQGEVIPVLILAAAVFVLGGGVSKKHREFLPLLRTQARVVPAQLLNEAGIVGAALAAKALV